MLFVYFVLLINYSVKAFLLSSEQSPVLHLNTQHSLSCCVSNHLNYVSLNPLLSSLIIIFVAFISKIKS